MQPYPNPIVTLLEEIKYAPAVYPVVSTTSCGTPPAPTPSPAHGRLHTYALPTVTRDAVRHALRTRVYGLSAVKNQDSKHCNHGQMDPSTVLYSWEVHRRTSEARSAHATITEELEAPPRRNDGDSMSLPCGRYRNVERAPAILAPWVSAPVAATPNCARVGARPNRQLPLALSVSRGYRPAVHCMARGAVDAGDLPGPQGPRRQARPHLARRRGIRRRSRPPRQT